MTRENTLHFEGLHNARHLGNLTTQNGQTTRDTLIRTEKLNLLTDKGKADLLASGVSLILDVRSPHELLVDVPPFRDHPKVQYLNLPLMNETHPEAQLAFREMRSISDMYRLMVTHFKPEIGAAMKALANAKEGKVLVHCHAGKDRTGMVVALALALVGVPDEVIAQDYALTDQNMAGIYREMLERETDPHKQAFMKVFMVSPPEAMLNVLEHLRAEYGSIPDYLQACGVTEEELGKIQSRLLN